MTMLLIHRLCLALSLLLGLAVVGCEGGASCKEACDADDDCESGLACFPTRNGDQCLPAECGNCFESSRTCYYDENLSAQAEGEAAVCEFARCE